MSEYVAGPALDLPDTPATLAFCELLAAIALEQEQSEPSTIAS